jgi:hypothetical protein
MSASIRWNPDVERFDANPAATVVLDRAAWERAGAVFVEQDDGDDEVPGLAVGEIAAGDELVQFGVLDYGEQETFLLVPGRDRAAVDTARAVLSALQAAGVVDLTTQLADFSAGGGPSSSHVPLEERVEVLERQFAELAPLTLQLTQSGTVRAYPAIEKLLSQEHRIPGQLRLPNVVENVEDLATVGFERSPSPDEDAPMGYPYLLINRDESDLAQRYQWTLRELKREKKHFGTIASVRGEKDEEG